MSEEEREALRNFKSEYETCNHNSSDLIIELDDSKIILNLIEEQSKEIEELKEKCRELIFEKQELLDSTPNTKIKAKIEPKLKELDEQINEEWKRYGNSKELQDMENMYNFLQSLLEKE